MTENQEKADKQSGRRPAGAGRKQKNDEVKTPDNPTDSGEKKKDKHFLHRKSEKENKTAQNPHADEPITFNAHALDMEPGVLIPPRPSVDLTYNDFTRESYHEDGSRPFVPKKKKSVPFELSETPRMQSEYWESKTPSRRRLNNSAENASSAEPREESRKHQEQKHTDALPASAEKATGARVEQQPKQGKNKAPRKEQGRNPAEGKTNPNPENQTHSRDQGSQVKKADGAPADRKEKKNDLFPSVKKRQKKTGGSRLEKRERNEDNGGADPSSQEPTKESLMRPYWMKK